MRWRISGTWGEPYEREDPADFPPFRESGIEERLFAQPLAWGAVLLIGYRFWQGTPNTSDWCEFMTKEAV